MSVITTEAIRRLSNLRDVDVAPISDVLDALLKIQDEIESEEEENHQSALRAMQGEEF